LRILTIYFLGVVLGAMVLAPPLYWTGQTVGGWFGWRPFVESGFERYFNRAILITAVLGLIPVVRALRVRDRATLGLVPGLQPGRFFVLGAGLALAMVLVEVALLTALGVVTPGGEVVGFLGRILMTALVVSLIEESLFRGVLQTVVQRAGAGRTGALVIVAVLFGLVHYVKPPGFAVMDGEVAWWSGFALAPHFFWLFDFAPAQTWAGLLNLTVVGLILGRAVQRTGGLALPVGLHVGWILGLESGKRWLQQREALWPWVSQDLLGGLLPLLLLLATWWAVERLPLPERSRPT